VFAPGEFGFESLDEAIDAGCNGAFVMAGTQPGESSRRHAVEAAVRTKWGESIGVALVRFAACAAGLVWATSAVPTVNR
jgi:hypothetical protein